MHKIPTNIWLEVYAFMNHTKVFHISKMNYQLHTKRYKNTNVRVSMQIVEKLNNFVASLGEAIVFQCEN